MSSPIFRRSPFALALLMSFAPAAQAEDADASPTAVAEATMLPEIRVIAEGEDDAAYAEGETSIGKTPTAIRDLPQTVNVVNRAVIDAQAATSIKDALRYVPGITISAGEGGQIGDNINLRGFSARTDVYLDGFRDRGQYSRDTFFVEAVEVLKGPASMLFGRGSTGGVINQVSKTPSLRERHEFGATIGTDDYYRATADLNQPLSDTSAMRIAVMGQDLQSTRDEVYARGYGIAPALRLGIGTPTEITLSALVQKSDELPDYGFPMVTAAGPGTIATPARAPHDRFYGYGDDHFDQDVTTFGATIQHKLSAALTLRTRTQYARSSIAASPTPLGALSFADGSAGTPTQSTPLEDIDAQRQDRDREVEDTALFNQTDLVATFATGPVAHTLLGGVEIGVDEFANDRYLWTPTSLDVNLGHPVAGPRPGARTLQTVSRTSADTVAVYVNDQAKLGEHWTLVGGLRWDHFRATGSVVGYNPDGTLATPVAQPPDHTDRMLSTRAGVLFQPDEAQSYYVSYGTSFNPSAEAVTQSSGSTAANAGLDPEKNRSVEAGAKLDLLDGALSLTGAVFRIEKTNARTQSDPGLSTLALEGEVRLDGVEVGLVGRLTPNWQAMAGYTWLDSEIVRSNTLGSGNNAGLSEQGKRFQNTPEHQATLWTTYVFLRDFEAGAGLVWSSDRPVNNFESAFIDGYTRADATLAWHQRRFDLRLNLQNATDEEYFEAASGGRATPVRGRTVLLGATLRFGKGWG